MRKPIIAGNWKMHKTHLEGISLVRNLSYELKDDDYTQTVKAAATELDTARRKQLYSRINDIILDSCFTMPLCSLLQVSVSTSKVHGIVRERSGGGLNLTSTWMD